MSDLANLAFCKIFPSIGVARVGDSMHDKEGDGWFIGPEVPEDLDRQIAEEFGFRDAEGRIKRQVARFRIFGFDGDGNVLREITHDDAEIRWTCQLANKKAAWFEFDGAQSAMAAFVGERTPEPTPEGNLRNATVGSLQHDPAGPFGSFYKPDPEREKLEIVSQEQLITGPNQHSDKDPGKHQFKLKGWFKGVKEVYLGELRTDEKGRLLVFGGRGESDAIDKNGNSIRNERWITNYANNDDWYDDVSDGCVRATIRLRNGNQAVEVRGSAWVIVASPSFAPNTHNIVDLYDVMEEVVHDNPQLRPKEVPEPGTAESVVYADHIRPILERMLDLRWVNDLALRGHGMAKPGDIRSALDGNIANPCDPNGEVTRARFFEMLRVPIYERPDHPDEEKRTASARILTRASEQANSYYMPPLSGDEGDRADGAPARWLSLTHLQYARMVAWRNGRFSKTSDHIDANSGNIEPKEKQIARSPHILTRTALEQCVGGAFFPGIETTVITRHPKLYSEAYRIDDNTVQPGDLTKYMAVPWQADFFECRGDWWPAQRPDDVLVDEDLDELFASFEEESVGNPAVFEQVLFRRKPWARGFEIIRPAPEFLEASVLPEVAGQETLEQYSERVKDSFFSYYTMVAPFAGGISPRFNERLPSPWRKQYEIQEALDRFSGRYLHLSIPSPEAAMREADPSRLKDVSRGLPAVDPDIIPGLEDLRDTWSSFRIRQPQVARSLLSVYCAALIPAILRKDFSDIVDDFISAECDIKDAGDLRDRIKGASVGRLENENPQDFDKSSPVYARLRLAALFAILQDIAYLRHRAQSGDMEMVDRWRHQGFVVERHKEVTLRDGKQAGIDVVVETGRNKYDGLSYRDYFYFLLNIDQFPDFRAYSKQLAKEFLEEAGRYIEQPGHQDEGHPESFVEYNKVNLDAKLEQIYEIQRSGAENAAPWRVDRNRERIIMGTLQLAPFNQTDGSWLRNIAKTGPTDEVRSLLFQIWSDEIGEGNPALHHGNLYTSLLRSLGHWLPEVASRAYADNPEIDESFFIGAVVPLVISEHSEDFYPELLGMTLFLEWEVLSLVPGVKLRDYLGIDSLFYTLHVGIDNATNGHGYLAKRAVELYLDHINGESGHEAMQEHWRRVWSGFVAFALSGGFRFTNGPQSDFGISLSRPPNAADRVAEIMRRKKPYGNLNHLDNRIGDYRINDLFDNPQLFMDELAHSPWIVPGDPDRSPFIDTLTSYRGPMFKIFSDEDLETWREWIVWLGEEGNTSIPKEFISKADAMLILLHELREKAKSEPAHTRYFMRPGDENSGGRSRGPRGKRNIADWFNAPDLRDLMKALKNPENNWVVPGRPEDSPLIREFAQGGRPMGRLLDQRFAAAGNRIGRLIMVEWIAAGCPIPGEAPPDPAHCAMPREVERPKLLVDTFWDGMVH